MNVPKHRYTRFEPLPQMVRPFVAMSLHQNEPYVALLESRGDVSRLGRYSFLCSDPFLIFRSKRDACFAGPPGRLERLPGEPLAELQSLLRAHGGGRSRWAPDLPPFLGGAVGYLGYEMLYLIEDVPDTGKDDLGLPDSYLMFCNTVLAADALREESWLVTTGFGRSPDEASGQADLLMDRAMTRLARLGALARPTHRAELAVRREGVVSARPRLAESDLAALGIRPNIDHAGYLDVVRTAKEHIFAGDVFEVCTTNRFDVEYRRSGSELYRLLSGVNQAPFAAYLRFPEAEVISSSPERFLSLDRDGWAETRPIKGTRPRGRTPEEDARHYADLASCEKDQAENIMIVDLARNDLGRVCEFGSVTVPELRVIESYPFTHQLVSTVRGHLRPDCGPIDLIRATFPGGSMTGAPKVEAMRIIDRLEPVKRGIYSGSIGYFDFDGSFDLSIVIRTFVRAGNRLTFHVGGAIVADSDPEQEYQETLDKARGLVTTLEFGGMV